MALTSLEFEHGGEVHTYTLANTNYGVLKAALDLSNVSERDAHDPCVPLLVGSVDGMEVEDAPTHLAWLAYFAAQAFLAAALTSLGATSG